jgi:hypothetical protein
LEDIQSFLAAHGLPGMTINRIAPNIEDAFMEFSTRKLHG